MKLGDIFVALAAVLNAALLCTQNGFCLLFIQMILLSRSGDLAKDLCQTAVSHNHAADPDDW